MPLKRGRLKPEDEVKIVKNYVYLKDNFDPSDGALDYMIGALVFDAHDNDKVRNGGENTQRGRVERFIEILQNSGTDAIAGSNTKQKVKKYDFYFWITAGVVICCCVLLLAKLYALWLNFKTNT